MREIQHSKGRYDIVYDDYNDKIITHNSYERRKEDGAIDALKRFYEGKNKVERKDEVHSENNKKLISLKINKRSSSSKEIIKEVIPEERTDKESKEKTLKSKWLFLVLLILFAAFFVYLLFLNIPTKIEVIMSKTEKTRLENVTLTDKIPIKIYFYNITKNLSAYNHKNLTLKGFLEQRLEGKSNAGVYVNYIVDDEGNSIKLLFKSNQTDLKDEFFKKLGKSEEIYQVSGVFTTGIEDGLQVNAISLSQREFIEITHQETREISYTEKLSFFDKIRLIAENSKYLFSFTCEDGTPWNKCSRNQPYFCTANRLIEKPEKCGCPNGKRIYENKCIPII